MAFELLTVRLITSGDIPLYLPAASAHMASPPASAHQPWRSEVRRQGLLRFATLPDRTAK